MKISRRRGELVRRKIVLTGGGSTGHVSVNLALIPVLLKEGWDILYIGSRDGIEQQLVKAMPGVQYVGIATGKLRRYFDWKNISDPIRVMRGVYQAWREIRRFRPSVLFSKGGFVSVPVIAGGWLNRVPVVIHESDLTPGLANRISTPLADRVCITFADTASRLPKGKTVHVGPIVRDELMQGDATRGLSRCSFTRRRPVLLIMGGSLGSRRINQSVRDSLDELLVEFQIVHLCGKGNRDDSIKRRGYIQLEYASEELPDLLAMSDVVVSRAGSNSIFEFLALGKPMLLIPLTLQASRGDQLLNARAFVHAGYADQLEEEQLTRDTLVEGVNRLYRNRESYKERMQVADQQESLRQLIEIIGQAALKSG